MGGELRPMQIPPIANTSVPAHRSIQARPTLVADTTEPGAGIPGDRNTIAQKAKNGSSLELRLADSANPWMTKGSFASKVYQQSLNPNDTSRPNIPEGKPLDRVLDWMTEPPYNVDINKIPPDARQTPEQLDKWLQVPANARTVGLRQVKNVGDLADQRLNSALVFQKPSPDSSLTDDVGFNVADFGRSYLANGSIMKPCSIDDVGGVYLPIGDPAFEFGDASLR